jgi:hypothetical protein
MDPHGLLKEVTDGAQPASLRLAAAGRLRNWLDATCLGLTSSLVDEGACAEVVLADAQRLSARSVGQAIQRAATADVAPLMADVVANGAASVEHIDSITRALRRLDATQRQGLLDQQSALATLARTATPEQFEREVAERVRALQSDADREARLTRQRCAARLRTWVDRNSGMWCLRGEFDPVTGLALDQALQAELASRFSDAVPATAPQDPIERNHHLLAHSLAALVTDRDGSHGSVRSEVIMVLRPEPDGSTRPDWAVPIDVPDRVVGDLVASPLVTVTKVVVSADGAIVCAPGKLDLGRSTRLANRAQRRALRAAHSTCSIVGCTVPFRLCKIHHIVWWRHGGPTDLANLTPLCNRHHSAVHSGHVVVPARPPPDPSPSPVSPSSPSSGTSRLRSSALRSQSPQPSQRLARVGDPGEPGEPGNSVPGRAPPADLFDSSSHHSMAGR